MKLQRGKTPWVPSQPTAIRPKVCDSVRTWSGRSAHRRAKAARVSSATGRVARSRLPSRSIIRCHRADCLLTSLAAPSRLSVRTCRSAWAPRPGTPVAGSYDGGCCSGLTEPARRPDPSVHLLRSPPRRRREHPTAWRALKMPRAAQTATAQVLEPESEGWSKNGGMPRARGGFPSRSPRHRGTGTGPTWSGKARFDGHHWTARNRPSRRR